MFNYTFELLYRIHPQLPSFPNQNIQQVQYEETTASEYLILLQQLITYKKECAQTKSEEYQSDFHYCFCIIKNNH
jgi:hypothetical protein